MAVARRDSVYSCIRYHGVAMLEGDDFRIPIRALVNGAARELQVRPDDVLVDVLRDDLGLTGTKKACSVGVCGVCSVIVDGVLLSACLLPAVRVDGRRVTTIEGIGGVDGAPTELQRRFVRHGGLQCGICTPGQVLAATALLEAIPAPSEAEVRDWMTGNLCRCTGYYGIVEAILATARGGAVAEIRPDIEILAPNAIDEAIG